jgi:LacI family transcriptional regulator
LHGDFTEESGYRAGILLAEMTERPDAVFVANDTMAIGCLLALAEKGVRVPLDMTVAGFDDIPVARLIRPSLTTVRTSIADLSRRALERLAAAIWGEDETKNGLEIVQPHLVLRESSAWQVTTPAKTAVGQAER